MQGLEDNQLLTKDWETTGLDYDADPLLLSLHYRGSEPVIIPNNTYFSKGIPLQSIIEICNREMGRVQLIAHNAKYDSMISKVQGIKDSAMRWRYDTMVMVHCYNPELKKKLEDRVKEDFGYEKKTFKEIVGKNFDKVNWVTEGDELLEALAGYAGEDTFWETKLFYKYREMLDEQSWKIHDKIELPLIGILRDAKIRGVLIDVPLLKDMGERCSAELENCVNTIYEEAGCVFNLNSPKQKQEVFFDKMHLPVSSYTGSGQPATDSATFSDWASRGIPVGVALERYSELNKLKSGYIDSIPLLVDKWNVLRGDLNSCGTETGRMSSSNPNLQNQPNNHDFPIRAAFIPRPGYVFVNYDYSQLELRVMAHMSHDKKFMQIFHEGRDPHGEVAEAVGITRKQAKCVSPETLIFTESGVKRIGDLSAERNADTFSMATCGRIWNGSDFVDLNSFYSNGQSETMLVVSRRGVLRCSKQHKLLMADGTMKPAGELSVGDVLAGNAEVPELPAIITNGQCIRFNPFFDGMLKETFSFAVDETWAYIAGVLTGDGCFSSKHIGVAVGSGRFFRVWRDELIKVFASKGLPLTERKSGRNYLYLGSSRFVKFMIPFGLSDERGKKNFKIPMWVLNGSVSLRKQFLCGLIDTDGTVSETGTTNICTKSIQLVEDLCFLLSSIGYEYGVEPSYNKAYKRWYYKVHIYSPSLPDLLAFGGLRCPYKVEALKVRVAKVSKRPHRKENSVLQVESIGTGYLCDVNVEGHIYVSGTLRTHNTLNFGVLYGMGPDKYVRTFGVTRKEAENMIENYHRTYDGFARWKTATENYARKHGYVRNLFGRIRRLPEAKKDPFHRDNGLYFKALRQSVNTIIQGTGADIVKLATIAMCNEFKRRNLDAHFLLQVHDEVVIEARMDQMLEVERIVIDCMQNTTKLDVPLIADGKIITNWAEMKDDAPSLTERFDYSLLMALC